MWEPDVTRPAVTGCDPQDHISSFPGPHLAMVLDSIAAGNTAGELWEISQQSAPSLLLLWDRGNNVFYLAGDCREEPLLLALSHFLAEEVRPRALAQKGPRFKARAVSPSLARALPRLFPATELRPYPTMFFTHPGGEVLVPTPVLPGVEFVDITAEALA